MRSSPSVNSCPRSSNGTAAHSVNALATRCAIGAFAWLPATWDSSCAETPIHFDAILLDVDNGPAALTTPANEGLYDNTGVAASYTALRPGGVLAVWSAWEDRKFEQRLRFHGFDVVAERVRARLKKGGPRHVIFSGTKPAAR